MVGVEKPPSSLVRRNSVKLLTKRTSFRRKSQKGEENYATFVRRVLFIIQNDQQGQVRNSQLSLSKETVEILNSFINDVYDRIVEESTLLLKKTGRKTLTERDIQYSARLVLPGSLADYSHDFANKSLTLFKNGGIQPSDASGAYPQVSGSISSESELLYQTFRSNIRCHSSPVRRSHLPTAVNNDSNDTFSVFENSRVNISINRNGNNGASPEVAQQPDISQRSSRRRTPQRGLVPRGPFSALFRCIPRLFNQF